MNVQLKALAAVALPRVKVDVLVLICPDGCAWPSSPAWVAAGLSGADPAWPSATGEWVERYAPSGWACGRLLCVRAGDASPAAVGKASAASMARAQAAKASHVMLYFLQQPTPASLAQSALFALQTGYRYSATRKAEDGATPSQLSLAAADTQPLQAAFEQASAIAAGVELARDWGNRPANHATPTHLVGVAQALAKFAKIKCTVHDAADLARLGMGALLAVARGSVEPPAFIELRYSGAPKSVAPSVLIGKGITFDSGGISIKPAAEMDEMKFDMCGAASVLGVFRALAQLKPNINVVGLIPTCENLPSGQALKPGDVVTSLNGTTIEVLNTDAEGRLILCDALSYAQRFAPAAVIDIATLTGACVIALGGVRSGLFCNDPALRDALLQAGERALDLAWPLPLDDDYAEGLKSSFADVANVAGRPAGAVTAAKFLQRFAPPAPWAHLDIAGTAWKSGAQKGATGRPVGLLVNYLLQTQAEAA